MYSTFLSTLDKFRKAGIEDALAETLRLFDIRSDGALGRACLPQESQPALDIDAVLRQRQLGVPLELIIGKACFMGRSFCCSRETFLPTPQSALLIEAAQTLLQDRMPEARGRVVLEVGTGCGNLAIILALTSPCMRVFASDISSKALAVARKNVFRYGLEHRVFLLAGDLLAPFQQSGLKGMADLVLSNPPYIPTRSIEKLPRPLVENGPRLAFDGGAFGIDIYRRLIKEAPILLKPGGFLLFEIGEMQERLISRMFEDHGGFRDISFYKQGNTVRAMSARTKQNAG